ncbi:hypothetical protein BU16DRAFT_534572 [Lophium mytilinum]|uniref:Uncharacterized protein n=1 Tax=Lophium mytilinum TaxID=390894 RepID=A0A6A6R904_9PEZI|nr:hypothetical protein BU16DRAFT_534572 [Lophium mytilinum]
MSSSRNSISNDSQGPLDTPTNEDRPRPFHELGLYDLQREFMKKTRDIVHNSAEFWQCLVDFIYELRPVEGETPPDGVRKIQAMKLKFLHKIIEVRYKGLIAITADDEEDASNLDEELEKQIQFHRQKCAREEKVRKQEKRALKQRKEEEKLRAEKARRAKEERRSPGVRKP